MRLDEGKGNIPGSRTVVRVGLYGLIIRVLRVSMDTSGNTVHSNV